MVTTAPGAIDTPSVIPSGGTQDVAYNSRTHPQNHNDLWAALTAWATKIGTGVDVAAANEVLVGTGAGATAFRQLLAADIADMAIAAIAEPSLIVNGNCDFFRRGTGARTHTTTYNPDTSYGPDRIFVLPAGASLTSQRSTTVPDVKSRYSTQINGAASVTTVDTGQRMPARIITTRGRQSLVFSCCIRNESGASFTPNLRVGTPTAADDFTTVNNGINQALQACADAAWTRVSYVFDPSADGNIANGMEVVLRIPSGSLTAGKVVRIAQFDVRPGTSLMAYLPPDPDVALASCVRYYWKSFPEATTPAQNTGSSTGALNAAGEVANGLMAASVLFAVPMIKVPTVTTFNPSAANANWSTGATASAQDVGEAGFTIAGSGTFAAPTRGIIHATAVAEL